MEDLEDILTEEDLKEDDPEPTEESMVKERSVMVVWVMVGLVTEGSAMEELSVPKHQPVDTGARPQKARIIAVRATTKHRRILLHHLSQNQASVPYLGLNAL